MRSSRHAAAAAAVLVSIAVGPVARAQDGPLTNASRHARVEVLSGLDADTPRKRVSPEMLAFQEHRRRVKTLRVPADSDVGGTALLGLQVGDKGLAFKAPVDEAVQAVFAEWDGYGAAVLLVLPGSPAEEAGLQVGDVVVRFAGLWIDRHATLIRIVTRAEPGQEYELQYLRGGDIVTTWVIPRDRAEVNPDATNDGTADAPQSAAHMDGSVAAHADEPAGEPYSLGVFGLRAPRLADGAAPEYPRVALDAGVQGDVLLTAVVDATGRVTDVQLVHSSGAAPFDAAAATAVKAFTYVPGHFRGHAVAVRVPVRIRFVLD